MERRVVVTGMGAISPLGYYGGGLTELTGALKQGRSGIVSLSSRPDRFKPEEAERLEVKIAGLVPQFDPKQFGISKKEARRLDPFSIYALIAARLALKDAGFSQVEHSEELNEAGVICATGIGGLTTFEQDHANYLSTSRPSPFTIPTLMPNAAAAQISIKYGLKGPVFSVSSACASGNHGIIDAYLRIGTGQSRLMLAGGSEASITPFAISSFAAMRALTAKFNDTPEKASRPFDTQRSGFVISEGAAMLVLEDLEHALERGANIYAEIIGFGETCDAHSIVAPDNGGSGAYTAMLKAVINTGLQAAHIDYINAHGTSTPLNDPIETKAIKQLFGDHAHKLLVSSTKSMHGHLMGAAGALESLICCLAIKERFIPPTINLENPYIEGGCNLNYVPNNAMLNYDVHIAMNNSFGFGGHNAVLVFEKYEK